MIHDTANDPVCDFDYPKALQPRDDEAPSRAAITIGCIVAAAWIVGIAVAVRWWG